MKRLDTILFALGCALFVALVWHIGARELCHELVSLGWGLVPFIVAEGLAEFIHTVGWRHCFTGRARSVPLLLLFRIRLAGYAINYLTPTAALGGEVTKASLLSSRYDASQAASGVLIGKVCFACAHLLFVALGSIAIVRHVHLTTLEWLSLLSSAGLVAVGILSFLLLQKYGKLGGLIRWLVARNIGGKPLKKIASILTTVDQQLLAFYRDRPADMCAAIGWHLLGYSLGIVPTWFFLFWLHPPAALSIAAAIWFLGMCFDLLTFAVPLNAGSLEGSRILALKFLGYTSSLGMTYGIALRFGQMFWATAGLLFYATFAKRKTASALRHSAETIGEEPLAVNGPHHPKRNYPPFIRKIDFIAPAREFNGRKRP